MIDLTKAETEFVVRLVEQSARLAKKVQQEMVAPALSKEDRSPVTVADFAVQALIGNALAEAFPQDCLVAEEDSDPLRTAEGSSTLERVTQFLSQVLPGAHPEKVYRWIDRGRGQCETRFWTLDPIDGTKGFLRGDQYAVALALIMEGQVQIGALGCPNLDGGWLVVAARGEGSWRRSLDDNSGFERLHVSRCSDPSRTRVLRSFESAHTNEGQSADLLAALGVQAEPILMDSQAKYALLAAGEGDLLFRLLSPHQPDYRERIWDQAAGSLIVEEAGGQITDLLGKSLDFSQGRLLVNNRGVLASNGHLHQTALKVLADESHK
jgi:3'(2'), 5'-bisphosphate nucleotidase